LTRCSGVSAFKLVCERLHVTGRRPELSKRFLVAATTAAQAASRLDGRRRSERFTHRSAREQLWYYDGLLAFFEGRRPEPLTADLARAVDELVWVLAVEDAQRVTWRRLWVDADLHNAQTPEGWIRVRTTAQAIALLDEFNVHEVSLQSGPGAHAVIAWLIDRGPDDPLLWPTLWLSFHGTQTDTWFDRLASTGSGPSAVSSPIRLQ
jgi:hypothetical protein